MAATAYINREVLRWAIDRAAQHIDTEAEARWLETDKYPTIRQAQAIAKRLSIPFGYLFLSESPDDELPIPDLRTRILFMLGLLAVYRMGSWIPTPGVDTLALQQFFEQQAGTIFGFLS